MQKSSFEVRALLRFVGIFRRPTLKISQDRDKNRHDNKLEHDELPQRQPKRLARHFNGSGCGFWHGPTACSEKALYSMKNRMAPIWQMAARLGTIQRAGPPCARNKSPVFRAERRSNPAPLLPSRVV